MKNWKKYNNNNYYLLKEERAIVDVEIYPRMWDVTIIPGSLIYPEHWPATVLVSLSFTSSDSPPVS